MGKIKLLLGASLTFKSASKAVVASTLLMLTLLTSAGVQATPLLSGSSWTSYPDDYRLYAWEGTWDFYGGAQIGSEYRLELAVLVNDDYCTQGSIYTTCVYDEFTGSGNVDGVQMGLSSGDISVRWGSTGGFLGTEFLVYLTNDLEEVFMRDVFARDQTGCTNGCELSIFTSGIYLTDMYFRADQTYSEDGQPLDMPASGFAGDIGAGHSVPEPSIIALFALGLIGLGFARRKIKK